MGKTIMNSRSDILKYLEGSLADAPTCQRIREELMDSESEASQFVAELCSRACFPFDQIDWEAIALGGLSNNCFSSAPSPAIENLTAGESVTLLDSVRNMDRLKDLYTSFQSQYTPLVARWLKQYHPDQSSDEDIAGVLKQVVKTIATTPRRSGQYYQWLQSVVSATLTLWKGTLRTLDDGGRETISEPLAVEPLLSLFVEDWKQETIQRVENSLVDQIDPSAWEAYQRLVINGESPRDVAAALVIPVAEALLLAQSVKKHIHSTVDNALILEGV